jgi:hypothetical protein
VGHSCQRKKIEKEKKRRVRPVLGQRRAVFAALRDALPARAAAGPNWPSSVGGLKLFFSFYSFSNLTENCLLFCL